MNSSTNPSIVLPHLSVMSNSQIEQVHHYSLELLSKVGIRVDSVRALNLFAKAVGTKVENDRVRIFPCLIESALNSAPALVELFDREGKPAFQAGDGRVHFGVGVTNLFYQDPLNDKLSTFTREHMAIGTRLGQALPAYDLVSTIGIIHNLPHGTEDLYSVLEMLANTTKPLVILNSDPKQFSQSLDLLDELRGDLSGQPFAIPYLNPVTPLIINRETGDKMIASIERGLPVIYSNYSMAGTTTPITAAGTLALLNAELLAGLVLSQLVKPGAPIILGSLPAFFDMKSMSDFYDPHTILINAACAEMMSYYHLPHAGTSGAGLGWGADLPAAGMYWLNHLTTSLGKTGLVPFVGGSLGSKAFSPTSVVYANDVILQARHFASGFPLNDDSVGISEIEAIGPGGNFLMTRSTRQNFRNAYYTSDIFPRLTLEKWEQKGHPQAINILKQETIRLISETHPPEDYARIMSRGEVFIQKLFATRNQKTM